MDGQTDVQPENIMPSAADCRWRHKNLSAVVTDSKSTEFAGQ